MPLTPQHFQLSKAFQMVVDSLINSSLKLSAIDWTESPTSENNHTFQKPLLESNLAWEPSLVSALLSIGLLGYNIDYHMTFTLANLSPWTR